MNMEYGGGGPCGTGAKVGSSWTSAKKGSSGSSGTGAKDQSCPWVLHISKGKDDACWMVKTFENTHKCLQSMRVKACTSSFLSKEFMQTIIHNREIPIKALQMEMQRKYGQKFSHMKAFRAKCLELLGDDLDLNVRSNFTFISDRQKGIIPAIAKIFPSAEHRFCVKHIHDNMKLTWRGQELKIQVWVCAAAATVPEFEEAMKKLKSTSSGAYDWLRKIPLHHWSRAHFIVDARDKPIITCLEYIREYLMKRIGNVNMVIQKAVGPLTPTAAGVLESIKNQAINYDVIWSRGTSYQKKMYSFHLQPINGPKMWPKVDCPLKLIPPTHHKQVGHPKKKRQKSITEITEGNKLKRVGKTVRCVKCNKEGQNKRTCKG
ncbi:hypothetical protein OSB04_001709 [Centaurea solstitialis]|uniref:MULE transposase domain-containing protein n=1 Tax=Centaurea solstitialis TaxID=347529 RepID=A0AA38TZ18_9ASTR|nr:hypothetical protein OSB04_001709 [Centaurea solstitialis]